MDYGAYFTPAKPMKMAFLYSLACVGVLLIQTGFIHSLPDPWRLFPLFLISGVILLHERSWPLGALWIVMGGIILESRGLGAGLALASAVAAVAATFLVTGVFAKRSGFALIGVMVGTVTAFWLSRFILLFLFNVFTTASHDLASLLGQGIITLLFAVIGSVLLGTFVRRFTRWSRLWFVRRPDIYDPSPFTR